LENALDLDTYIFGKNINMTTKEKDEMKTKTLAYLLQKMNYEVDNETITCGGECIQDVYWRFKNWKKELVASAEEGRLIAGHRAYMLEEENEYLKAQVELLEQITGLE
jgi:hypothetical protein